MTRRVMKQVDAMDMEAAWVFSGSRGSFVFWTCCSHSESVLHVHCGPQHCAAKLHCNKTVQPNTLPNPSLGNHRHSSALEGPHHSSAPHATVPARQSVGRSDAQIPDDPRPWEVLLARFYTWCQIGLVEWRMFFSLVSSTSPLVFGGDGF